jgi:protein-tyrosine phosphatase
MFNSILVVCVGNICRSPMAEALLRKAIESRGIAVSSAGIGALVGHAADETAQALMLERGIDISCHRARQLDGQLVREADLILVMEQWQQKEIDTHYPTARGKVHCLGKWSDFEIPDPYRRPRQAFEAALESIDQGINDWTRKFWQ